MGLESDLDVQPSEDTRAASDGGGCARSNLGASDSNDPSAVTARSSLLQPRLAVVLGVSEAWHPLLFLCRLLSIAPALFWGFPLALRLLAMIHLMFFGRANFKAGNPPETSLGAAPSLASLDMTFEARLRLTETFLATIWCGASGYLSFFFTDCLMSRWLVNYTPQATIVRLLTIAATNTYLTSCALWVTGGFADPRLLLPVWIAISTTLTAMYHVTQRKINIRKETSMSISVFSIASFISMVALLAQLHSNRTNYPQIPMATMAKRAWQEVETVASRMMEYTGNTGDIL
ncbi:N-glycosylation protein-domain-containing protein [Immersiella caudata]|uniref:N-glycosylation protein-domain-containing protein n=1 Tax=Immersiella caudata TaxID=314043 RepID=A0AA39XIF0_9PEZI|nr:N-glycosylation protein-domain-containing protein [Immersiella caudata]